MPNHWQGTLSKMPVTYDTPIRYHLPLGDERIALNPLLGRSMGLQFTGKIICVQCGRPTTKSFFEGFCYPCFRSAPQASDCVVRPELCRAHEGKGRDMAWETEYHLVDHVVYLAATSHLKVGITRANHCRTRWIDQGAHTAVPIARTPNRYLAGMMEVALKRKISDRTSWQKMLKGEDIAVDFATEATQLVSDFEDTYRGYLITEVPQVFSYPVLAYPLSVKSIQPEKTTDITATLIGIRGQYLMFGDGRVLNVRKCAGYEVRLTV